MTFSQDTVKNTITLPIEDARAAVKIIESLRIDSMMLTNDKRILSERITARDNTINQLTQRINTYKLLEANYDKQVSNLNAQMKLSEEMSKDLSKRLKWANTKTVITGAVGLAATILLIIYK